MHRPALDKFIPYLEAGGVALINSSLVEDRVKRQDVKAYYVPSSEIASELGNLKVANTVMLGAFVELTRCIEGKSVLRALLEKLGAKKAHLIEVNRVVFARGAGCVRQQQEDPDRMKPVLIIGYGNTLRGDDGFGLHVAQILEHLNLPDVEVITTHQLTPELAEPLGQAARALFIDASTHLPGAELRWQDVPPSPLPRHFTHHVQPGHLLTLATQLYGQAASAQLLTVGVQQSSTWNTARNSAPKLSRRG